MDFSVYSRIPNSGDFQPTRGSPSSGKAKPPIPIQTIWGSAEKRFRKRAKSSGFKNADQLWSDALNRTKEGWLNGPRDISSAGDIDILGKGNAYIAFRFGVCQFYKLRARGDLKQNMVNLATSVLAPISLPSWGHITQLSKEVASSKLPLSFLKTDRKDAYKQLPPSILSSPTLRSSHSGALPRVVGRALFLRCFYSVRFLQLSSATDSHGLLPP